MLVSYYPKAGKERELLSLLQEHWPTFDRLGLVTAMQPQLWRAYDIRARREYFVEMFECKDGNSSDVAHQSPEVMAIWEPMGPLLDNLQLSELDLLGDGAQG